MYCRKRPQLTLATLDDSASKCQSKAVQVTSNIYPHSQSQKKHASTQWTGAPVDHPTRESQLEQCSPTLQPLSSTVDSATKSIPGTDSLASSIKNLSQALSTTYSPELSRGHQPESCTAPCYQTLSPSSVVGLSLSDNSCHVEMCTQTTFDECVVSVPSGSVDSDTESAGLSDDDDDSDDSLPELIPGSCSYQSSITMATSQQSKSSVASIVGHAEGLVTVPATEVPATEGHVLVYKAMENTPTKESK